MNIDDFPETREHRRPPWEKGPGRVAVGPVEGLGTWDPSEETRGRLSFGI